MTDDGGPGRQRVALKRYVTIARQVEEDVPPGARMALWRELAAEHGVTVRTLQRRYRDLFARPVALKGRSHRTNDCRQYVRRARQSHHYCAPRCEGVRPDLTCTGRRGRGTGGGGGLGGPRRGGVVPTATRLLSAGPARQADSKRSFLGCDSRCVPRAAQRVRLPCNWS